MQEAVTEHMVVAVGSTATLYEGSAAECLDWARERVQRGDVSELQILSVTVAVESIVWSNASVKSVGRVRGTPHINGVPVNRKGQRKTKRARRG